MARDSSARAMRWAGLATAVLAVAWVTVSAQPHYPANMDTLSPTCSTMLNNIYGSYSNAVYSRDGCSPECLHKCGAVVQEAINSADPRDCPLQSETIYCMGLFSVQWTAYVTQCSLFGFTDPNAEADAEAALLQNRIYNASRTVAYLPADQLNTTSRRRLLAGAPAGEAESEGAGEGCFPIFASPQEFNLYITGGWYTTEWSYESQTGGIIVSTFFWVALTLLVFVLKWPKPWRKKKALALAESAEDEATGSQDSPTAKAAKPTQPAAELR